MSLVMPLAVLGLVVGVLLLVSAVAAVRDGRRARRELADRRACARQDVIDELGRCAVVEAERIAREGARS